MASLPQKPEDTHKKNTSKVSIRTINRGSGEEEEPAGRQKLERLNTNIGKRRNGVELIPKPSDDPRDPLNWPIYKKELTFASLMLATSVVGISKTIYVSTNSVIATQFNTSYMGAASFTGLPFIFAAFSGVGASILTTVIGKRSIYVVGGILMLVGALWNMHAQGFAQFMVSRLFQGIGWGMTEALMMDSIRDIFFVHERNLRTNIYTVTSLTFTWGSPILGGYISQTSQSFRQEIMVLTIIQAFSILFILIFVPETSFSPSSTSTTTSEPSVSPFRSYVKSLHPILYRAPFSAQCAMKPIRVLGAPTTILTFLITFPLIAAAYAVANSLALLFAAMPTFLFPSRLGFIFILPFVFSLFTFSLVSVTAYVRSRPPRHITSPNNLVAIIPGAILGVSGLLAFGLYTSNELTPKTISEGDIVFTLDATGIHLSLKVVSALFGMLVASTTVLSYSASTYLSPSAAENSHMESGYRVWLDVFTGIFIIAMPSWIQMHGSGGASTMNGLKDTSIALAVTQLVVASTAGAVLWVKGEEIRRMDSKIIGVTEQAQRGVGGSVELKRWDSQKSYFEV